MYELLSLTSYAGETSTKSIANLSGSKDLESSRIILMPSREVSPLGSGSPVPGAYAGSKESMSQLRYTASVPSLALSAISLAM